jgi:hypothetical protein
LVESEQRLAMTMQIQPHETLQAANENGTLPAATAYNCIGVVKIKDEGLIYGNETESRLP